MVSFCMTFSAICRNTARLLGPWSEAVALLILVHHNIQPPVQPIFHPPMRADHLQKALAGQRRAEQVVSCLLRGFVGFLADAVDLANGHQAWPVMLLLQPVDIAREGRRARLDASMIAVDSLRCRGPRASGIVQKQADVIMQRALIAFQRQSVVATLIDDLPSDRALTVERVHGHDRALQTTASPAVSAPR